ncbi:hypothetical protein Skr01_03730 [Sphaerisporangium krabiense]|nr:hypothetical protein Skr01_03730 [Sphaerisporangium krabiense]
MLRGQVEVAIEGRAPVRFTTRWCELWTLAPAHTSLTMHTCLRDDASPELGGKLDLVLGFPARVAVPQTIVRMITGVGDSYLQRLYLDLAGERFVLSPGQDDRRLRLDGGPAAAYLTYLAKALRP